VDHGDRNSLEFTGLTFDFVKSEVFWVLQVDNLTFVFIVVIIHLGFLEISGIFGFFLVFRGGRGRRNGVISHLVMVPLDLLKLIINCLKQLSYLILHAVYLSLMLLLIL